MSVKIPTLHTKPWIRSLPISLPRSDSARFPKSPTHSARWDPMTRRRASTWVRAMLCNEIAFEWTRSILESSPARPLSDVHVGGRSPGERPRDCLPWNGGGTCSRQEPSSRSPLQTPCATTIIFHHGTTGFGRGELRFPLRNGRERIGAAFSGRNTTMRGP